jgi:3-phenylpropionate/cinnamic acid dioxygenase small subunit
MSDDIQYLLDYVAIRQLNALYNRLADGGDGDAYSQLYTEDAEFNIVGNQTYCGRKEIASAAAATKVTVHVTTEPEIEIDGDSATQRVRMLSVYRAEDLSRNDFVASGWYVDELKRTEDGWRYHRRRAELDLDIAEVFRKMTITESFAALAKG